MDLSKMIALFPMVHSYIYIYIYIYICIYIYIYQSHDCHVFSLVTVLGNMYNLCELHSLICMCSGCHSLSDCTFLYNYRCKYRYEAGVTVLVSPAILLDSCGFILLWQMFKPLLYGIMMLFG